MSRPAFLVCCETSKYRGNRVKVEIKEGEGLKREVKVEVPVEAFNTAMDNKFAELRRDVQVKGFRKGKTPMNMIKTMYGDSVKADVVDELIKDTMPKAIQENDLKVAGPPSITDLDLTDEGVLTYSAMVEVFPEVDKVDFEGLELQQLEVKVEDKEVDDLIDHMRKELSTLVPQDRAATDKDVVVVDMEKISDSKNALAESSFPESQIDLSNPMTVKEFREQIPGLKAGEEKEIEVVYEDDYADASFAGAKIKYLCKVKSVNEREMPELDDAFAKRTKQAETALELKVKVRENIQQQKDDNENRVHKRDVMRLMVEKNQIPIPETFVNEYLDSMLEDMKKSDQEFDEKEVREKYRPVGIESMRWDMIWHTLAEQQSIEVLEEDTENWIKGFAGHNNTTVEQARTVLNQSGRVNQLRESMLEGKVLDFLIGTAKKVPAKE